MTMWQPCCRLPRTSATGRAAATADASRKDSTGLTKLGDQLFNQIVIDWFVQHPDRYAEITGFVKGVTDRAIAILAS
jgi:hypothetical protein